MVIQIPAALAMGKFYDFSISDQPTYTLPM